MSQLEAGQPSQTSGGTSAVRALLRNQGVSMLLILGVMWVVLAFLSPYFFTVSNLFEITLQTAVIAIIAAGETFVIISGGIDLSVGSVFACAAVVGGLVFTSTGSLVLSLATTLGVGALLGPDQRPADHPGARPAVYRHAGHDGDRPRAGADHLGRHPHLRAGRPLQVYRPGQVFRRHPGADRDRAGGVRPQLSS